MTDELSAVIYQAKWREVTAVYVGCAAADARQPTEPSQLPNVVHRELCACFQAA
jgi:hypothetical protein